MNNMKRALAVVVLAGTALTVADAAYAADKPASPTANDPVGSLLGGLPTGPVATNLNAGGLLGGLPGGLPGGLG